MRVILHISGEMSGGRRLFQWRIHEDGSLELRLAPLCLYNPQFFEAVLERAFSKDKEFQTILFLERIRACEALPQGNDSLTSLSGWLRSENPHETSCEELYAFLSELVETDGRWASDFRLTYYGSIYTAFRDIDERLSKVSGMLKEDSNNGRLVELRQRSLMARDAMVRLWRSNKHHGRKYGYRLSVNPDVSLESLGKMKPLYESLGYMTELIVLHSKPPFIITDACKRLIFDETGKVMAVSARGKSLKAVEYRKNLLELVGKKQLLKPNLTKRTIGGLLKNYGHDFSEEETRAISSIAPEEIESYLSGCLKVCFVLPEELEYMDYCEIRPDDQSLWLFMDVRLLDRSNGKPSAEIVDAILPIALSRLVLHYISVKTDQDYLHVLSGKNAAIAENILPNHGRLGEHLFTNMGRLTV